MPVRRDIGLRSITSMFSTSCIQLRTLDFLRPVFKFTEQRESRRALQIQAAWTTRSADSAWPDEDGVCGLLFDGDADAVDS
jgi:hypothetical protein